LPEMKWRLLVKNKEMIKVFNEYFRCGTPSCHSIYHISNFNGREFDCRDCKKISEVPEEARPRKSFKPKAKK